jgi:MYXO-CTERM domain-containing protein
VPIGCSIDAQCDDGNPCTQNLCLIGLCLPLPVVGCCYQGVCEEDGSAGAGGEPPLVTGGCSTNEQCDDNNECTQNLCVLGLCTTLPVLGCDGSAGAPPVLGCSTNEECEDGNDCIQNLCLLGLCTSLPVIGGVCGGDGGSGGGGNGGSAGTAGSTSGGSTNGGNGGSAGTAGNGGSAVAGDAGAAGETNGGTSNGGTSSQAGTSNEAGKAGSAMNGGESSGGTETGGTHSGATNTGASAGEAGQSTTEPNIEWGMQGGGCGCKVVAAPRNSSLLSGLLAALGFVAIRARRRQRAS